MEAPQLEVLRLEPNSTAMVKFIASQMDAMFNALAEVVPFTTGDIMSACICHTIEAGKIGRDGDLAAVEGDIHEAVKVAIAHYSAPEPGERH